MEVYCPTCEVVYQSTAARPHQCKDVLRVEPASAADVTQDPDLGRLGTLCHHPHCEKPAERKWRFHAHRDAEAAVCRTHDNHVGRQRAEMAIAEVILESAMNARDNARMDEIGPNAETEIRKILAGQKRLH